MNTTIRIKNDETDQSIKINYLVKEMADYIETTFTKIQSSIAFLNEVKSRFREAVDSGKVSLEELTQESAGESKLKPSYFSSIWKRNYIPNNSRKPSANNDTDERKYTLKLSRIKIVVEHLKNIGAGCNFIKFIIESKNEIKQNGYEWLLENHEKLAYCIMEDDMNNFMANCCRYNNSYEDIEDLSTELKNHLTKEQRKNSNNVATLSSLPTFGFQYPNRIELLFEELSKSIEMKKEKTTADELLLININLIVTTLKEKMKVMQVKKGTYEPNLTICFRNSDDIPVILNALSLESGNIENDSKQSATPPSTSNNIFLKNNNKHRGRKRVIEKPKPEAVREAVSAGRYQIFSGKDSRQSKDKDSKPDRVAKIYN